jgi:hypothetical protein
MSSVQYSVRVFDESGGLVAARDFRQRPAAERFLAEYADRPLRECDCSLVGDSGLAVVPDFGSIQRFAAGDPVDLRYGWDL